MKKVQGHDLYKTSVGAIITTDTKLYERAKQRKVEREMISSFDSRLNRIEKLLEKLLNDYESN